MDTPRAVLVTGGASGIGRAVVEEFLDRGWGVVALDLNPRSATQLLADFDGTPHAGRIDVVVGDASLEADIEKAVNRVTERFGRLDCVVNNAGVGGAFGPVTDIAVDDWDYTFAVLVRGVFLGVKHGARAMKRQGTGGAIVNIGSAAGMLGDAGPQAYSVAKAAVIHMGRVFATELAPDRIRVNTVCPGIVETPLNPATGPGRREALAAAQPWPETGQPKNVAEVVCFLSGDESRFVTGESIAVDGGLIAGGPRVGTQLGLNSRSLGVTGVNRGTTGQKPTVRRPDQQTEHHPDITR